MKTHWSFWLVGIIALLWNAGGTANMFMQMNPEALSQMPESHQAIVDARPSWATIAFGVSVIGGVIGAVLYLMKKQAAIIVFAISLIGALVVTTQTVISNDIFSAPLNLTTGEFIMIIIGPIAAAALFTWAAKHHLST